MRTRSFEHILVVVDGSDGSRRALNIALSLCPPGGSRLTALAVEGRLPSYAASLSEVEDAKAKKDERFAAVLKDVAASAAEFEVEIETDLVAGSEVRAITRYAQRCGHDMIVIAHNRRRPGDYLFGSIADRVAHRAQCPVVVVR